MNTADIIKNPEIELVQPEVCKIKEKLDDLIAEEFFENGNSGKQYIKQDILNDSQKQTGIKFSRTISKPSRYLRVLCMLSFI
jgi:hypothetical protein